MRAESPNERSKTWPCTLLLWLGVLNVLAAVALGVILVLRSAFMHFAAVDILAHKLANGKVHWPSSPVGYDAGRFSAAESFLAELQVQDAMGDFAGLGLLVVLCHGLLGAATIFCAWRLLRVSSQSQPDPQAE